MLTTRRYDYLRFDEIQVHPQVGNHRALDQRKVAHYEEDILRNGLLEPLIVWEKKPGELFLVGGFHRRSAIERIRRQNPGYFDRVDARIVAGNLDEIRALNLKLNADRLDTKISDYFDVIVYLNNANWPREKIAQFLDRSDTWVADILRYVPIMDTRVRNLLEAGKLTWSRAKAICKAVQEAAPGTETAVLQRAIAGASNGANGNGSSRPTRPLTFRKAKKQLSQHADRDPNTTFNVRSRDLLSLLLVLEGKHYEDTHLEHVRRVFPGLLEA